MPVRTGGGQKSKIYSTVIYEQPLTISSRVLVGYSVSRMEPPSERATKTEFVQNVLSDYL